MDNAVVEIVEQNGGPWLRLVHKGEVNVISLDHTPGCDFHDFFARHVPKAKAAGHQAFHWTGRAVAWLTGAMAMLTVGAAGIAALVYVATHNRETLEDLASSTLQGVGIAVGGFLGSALILRYKAARNFVRSIIKDLQ